MRKKLCSIMIVLAIIVSSSAYAEMEVQLIGGPENNTETGPVSLDDVKLGTELVIEGYGKLTPINFTYTDWFPYEEKDYDSKYAQLTIDILNTTTGGKNYISTCGVKMIFDDKYEYAGWACQYDYDSSTDTPVASEAIFVINPLYIGHYAFVCKIPKAVAERKAPLKMIINLDDNEITYNVRK